MPVPGGTKAEEAGAAVTSPERAKETIELHKEAVYKRGMLTAWEGVIATIVNLA